MLYLYKAKTRSPGEAFKLIKNTKKLGIKKGYLCKKKNLTI